jgi:hypothetical protein
MTENENRLLVEGHGDRRLLPELLEKHGVPWPKNAVPVFIHALGSRDIDRQTLNIQLKNAGLRRLGIIFDADVDANECWLSIRGMLPTTQLPKELPAQGLVTTLPSGVRFGVWLMPDNVSRGMMETLLLLLRPNGNQPLLEHVTDATDDAVRLGATFKPVHRDKALVSTWLAWQDPPGQQLHEAVRSSTFDSGSLAAGPFVRWFRELFEITPP